MGHGEEHHKFRDFNIATACMLLGCVAFVMLLFYMVNWKDQDVRRYSWNTISVTLSIFVAVMIFTGINDNIKSSLEIKTEFGLVVFQYLHFTVWVGVLQLVLAYCSGALWEGPCGAEAIRCEQWVIADPMRHDFEEDVRDIGVQVRDPKFTKSTAIVDGLEVPVAKRKMEYHKRCRNMKCCGMILGHMAAFANIRAGHRMQNLHPFKSSPWMALLPIFINAVIVWSLFWLFDLLRERERTRQHAIGREGIRIQLYDEEAEETENEVLSLSSSFMIVQVVIFAITGHLPCHYGEGHGAAEIPAMSSAYWLFGASAVAALLTVVLHGEHEEHTEHEHEENFDRHIAERVHEMFLHCTAMTFAWSLREAFTRSFAQAPFLIDTPLAVTALGGKVLLAVFLSTIAALAILLLDSQDDSMKTGASKKSSKWLSAIIDSLPILVGLSWEESFDAGVEEIADRTPNPHRMELIFSVCVAIIIIPAWKNQILKKSMLLEEYREQQMEAWKHSEAEERAQRQSQGAESIHNMPSKRTEAAESPLPAKRRRTPA